MKLRLFIASCGALQAALTAATPARAQSVTPLLPYNIGDAVRQAEESRQARPKPPPAAPVLPRLIEPQFTLADKETLFVRKFELEGPQLVEDTETRAILAPYENRKLTLAEIYAAADKITTLYRLKGYLVAKAYVPAQNARRGVLRFKLVPGRYGAIALDNASLVSGEFLRAVIDRARDASPVIQKGPLERAMLLISDLPGAGAPRIAISRGQKPETSDFLFSAPQGKRFEGYLLGDNSGSPYTGRDRLNGGVSVNSLLGYGDRLTASGIVSEHANLANGRLAYGFPLDADGLRAEIGAFRTTYALSGVYKDLAATGSAYAIAATLTYALKRQREESIYLSANFTHKWLNDKIAGLSTADRTIDLGTLSVNHDAVQSLFGLPLVTNTSLSFTAGYVNFADPTQKANNIAGVDTVGNYYRINLSFNSIIAFDEDISLQTSLRAQKSFVGNLDSSEQMSVAGFWGVRSYDEGLAGDSGYLVTPELKYALPQFDVYRHSLGLFTDIGAAWLENGSYTTTQKSYTQLNDVGLGYYASYEYSSGRVLLVKAQVAHTYGSRAGAESYDRRTKGLVQVGFTF